MLRIQINVGGWGGGGGDEIGGICGELKWPGISILFVVIFVSL